MSSNKDDRRKKNSFVGNRPIQMRLALLSVSALFVPMCVASVYLVVRLANEGWMLAERGESGYAISQALNELAFNGTVGLLALMLVFAILSVWISLRLSHQIVGPVGKLESHVQSLIDGDYSSRTQVRSTDYLRNLAQGLNELSQKLEASDGKKESSAQ